MKLYVHKKTIRYMDYGDFLSTATGVAWSSDGENPQGFDRGLTVEKAIETVSNFFVGIEVVVGREVVMSCDMNPHGLI